MNTLMRQFIDKIDEIVKEGGPEEVITAKVAEKLQPLMSQPDLLPPEFTKPKETGYALYPIYIAGDESFSIAAAIWGVGTKSGIHDHGTWGVIGIYQGSEREERFLRDQNADLDSHANIEKHGVRNVPAGEVFVCCTSDREIHRVSCAHDVVTVGIHIYGADIGKITRHSFDEETGIASDLVTPWDIETPLYE